MDVPPPQPRQVQQLPPSESGLRCCGMGCLTLLVMLFVVIAGLAVGGWFLCNWALNKFTSPNPIEVVSATPSNAEFATASDKLDGLKAALRSRQPVTITFSAADLNALFARHPDFASQRGKTNIAIADSMATVEMSVPLRELHFRGMRERWFNGSARFTFIYAADKGFNFDAQWIEANGHRISSRLLNYGASSFNKSFTEGFESTVEKDDEDAWSHVKTMALEGDQLVVITRAE